MRRHYGQTKWAVTNQLSGRGIVVWIRFLLNQIYLTTMCRSIIPPWCILSICSWN